MFMMINLFRGRENLVTICLFVYTLDEMYIWKKTLTGTTVMAANQSLVAQRDETIITIGLFMRQPSPT